MLDELRTQDELSRRQRRRFKAEGTTVTIIGLDDRPSGSPDPKDDSASPHEIAATKTVRAKIREWLKSLDPRERRIIEASYFFGTPFVELAHEMGVTEPRISQLHSRALEKLRSAAEKDAIESPDKLL